MAETSNIARMAEIISTEIFVPFGWERVGPADQNWGCVEEVHGRETHPTDVAFRYDDPYENHSVYVLIDLKSYGAEAITRVHLKGALARLCDSVTCAHNGPHWKDLYHDGKSFFKLAGLLFVFNHSRNYADKGLISSLFNEISSEELDLPSSATAYVLGPREVEELWAISLDMRSLMHSRGSDGTTIVREGVYFWYPELVLARLQHSTPSAVDLDTLRGPTIITKCELVRTSKNGAFVSRTPHFTIWYRDPGDTAEEFQYLFDRLFRLQLLNDAATTVDLRMVNPAPLASSNFNRAKDLYSSKLYDFPRERLDNQVSFNSVPAVARRFSPVEIGWTR